MLTLRSYVIARNWCVQQDLHESITWDVIGTKEDVAKPMDQIWVLILSINLHHGTERNNYKESFSFSALLLRKTSLGAYERTGIDSYSKDGDLGWKCIFGPLKEQQVILV